MMFNLLKNYHINLKNSTFICLLFLSFQLYPQIRNLDNFESTSGWSYNKSDGVETKLSVDKGYHDNSIKFEYKFNKGTGYGGIQKLFPIDLPENFEFTFMLKAVSPANNFEIKFIDSSGNNVWWVNNRNFDFPGEWKKIRIKRRNINFAWGPTNDQSLKRIDRIEFTIASFVGGDGAVWLDDLKFEPLPLETDNYVIPLVEVNSSLKKSNPNYMLDNLPETSWISKPSTKHEIIFDFKGKREFGGLEIDWSKGLQAGNYKILISEDYKNWEEIYKIDDNLDDQSFIYLPETQSGFLKILISSPNKSSTGIKELKFINIKNALSKNDFLIYCAKNSKKGYYPSYFLEQATYWTISGVNNDTKEALINEYGAVEIEKAEYSLEPMIKIDDELYNWSNVNTSQTMGKTNDPSMFEFIPTVNWNFKDISFKTEIASGGEANKSSYLYIKYTFNNQNKISKTLDFYIIARPFQVNPYYQFLNLIGGSGKIFNISQKNDYIIDIDGKRIESQIPIKKFYTVNFDQGNIVKLLDENKLPNSKSINGVNGWSSAIASFRIELMPGESKQFILKIPYHDNSMESDRVKFDEEFNNSVTYWNEKINHIKFELPKSANRIINTIKSNLAFIMINRDRVGIQPGSRSYERSWIRDGALTSSALLKNGIEKEVKDFIEWYASNLYENGKVPCVVDTRGPDPVPENDSHGQFIYLIKEYFNFTKDTSFLRKYNVDVIKVVEYINSLITLEKKVQYLSGTDSLKAFYGLVPESISHEGYSAKPMHSYWDDFFILKGLKDAVEIQKILGENQKFKYVKAIKDDFQSNLYKSLDLAIKYKKIDYVPGCVELGDFDATSSTVLLSPCNEFNNLPKPQIFNTFDRYYHYFQDRKLNKIESVNYTPYENRVIGSFIILNEPEIAHDLIDFFLNDQRPTGWNQWAEVVWKDYRKPGYIGDMPHTWCGSDFINSIRSMFVYENELDQSLVLGAALYKDWIDNPGGMAVSNLPTYYGEVSYSVLKNGNKYTFNITGDLKLPKNGIKIQNFNESKMPLKVIVNGKEINNFTKNMIQTFEIPSMIEIYY